MLIAVLFMESKLEMQISINRRIVSGGSSTQTGHGKEKELLRHVSTWGRVFKTCPDGRSQTHEITYHMHPFIWSPRTSKTHLHQQWSLGAGVGLAEKGQKGTSGHTLKLYTLGTGVLLCGSWTSTVLTEWSGNTHVRRSNGASSRHRAGGPLWMIYCPKPSRAAGVC